VTSDDAGTRTVQNTFEELQIDEAWSAWSERGFTWWPHRLAQRVWAEEPHDDDGLTIIRINAETDVFSAVDEEWRQLSQVFAAASTFASMSGYAWSDDVIRLRCSMWVHDEVQPWVSRIFRLATIAQAVAAEDAVAQVDQLSPHESGERTEPDEMLSAVDDLPASEEPSMWAGEEMETLAQMLTSNGVMSMASPEGLSAEFPYGEHGGPAVAGGTSNLLTVSTSENHPRLGAGLLMRLSLREQPHDGDGPLGPMELNELEVKGRCQSHFLGSWCANPSGGPPVFVSFLPNILSAPNLLTNLVVSMGVRSQWASERFDS